MEVAQEFLYKLTPHRPEMLAEGPTEDENTILINHSQFLQTLEQEGTLILAGRTQVNDERSFGIVVFRAPNEAEASKIMQADPAVAGNVLHGELFPYKVSFFGTV